MKMFQQWPRVPLDDAFWFQEGPGVRKWQFTTSGIKLLNVGNIVKDGTINLAKTDKHLAIAEVNKKYSHFLADEGDLVIASSGITFGDDGFLRTRGAFIEKSHLPLCINTSTIRFKSIENISDLRFLRHWLSSYEFRFQITKLVTGTAQQNFGPSHLKSLTISLPPLPEQKRIAAILDESDSIRRKRQEAVRLTEELLRSVFLEMFGDPVTNPKGWETAAFADVCETRLGKMLDAKQQTGEHLKPYLRNSNVQWDRIETSDLEQMDFDEKDRKTFSLRNGDVLICEGGEVGRAAIWRNQATECYFQKAIHRARPNQSLALPEYVMFWLWFMSKNGGFKDHVTSATIAHLTGEKLKEIQMALPSITMQHQFLKVYNSLSVIKASTNKHLAQTEKLFNSILQQAFSGEFVEK